MAFIKHKNYLLFIVVVTLLAIYFVAAYPQIAKIKDNNQRISEEKLKLQNNIDTDKKIKEFQSNQTSFQAFNTDLESSLIRGENTLDLIIPLENIAREFNLKQNLEILEEEESRTDNKKDSENPLNKLEGQLVRLQLEGSYQNILYYFTKLNELGLMYDVETIELKQKGYSEEFNKEQDETNIGITQAVLEVKFFTK